MNTQERNKKKFIKILKNYLLYKFKKQKFKQIHTINLIIC